MVSKHTCVSNRVSIGPIVNAELLKIRRSYVKIALIKVWHLYTFMCNHFYNFKTKLYGLLSQWALLT